MKIFRNRTVIGVLCILLALVICFGVTPLFSRSASEKAEIVRVTADIKEGDEITAEMVQAVEVGAYNLPSGIMTEKDEVIGKYATADLKVGDYILASKLSNEPAAENAYRRIHVGIRHHVFLHHFAAAKHHAVVDQVPQKGRN